jgi:hypothetical protein
VSHTEIAIQRIDGAMSEFLVIGLIFIFGCDQSPSLNNSNIAIDGHTNVLAYH